MIKKGFAELMREDLPVMEHVPPITSYQQAYGIIQEIMDEFWIHAKDENDNKKLLEWLVGLAITCQVIGEFLYGIQRPTDDRGDQYKKRFEDLRNITTKLLYYIRSYGSLRPPAQIGGEPDINVQFDGEELKKLEEMIANV
jgi:hypothetical protein